MDLMREIQRWTREEIARALRNIGVVGTRVSAGNIAGQIPGTSLPWPATGYPVDVAATEADGTSTAPARGDHRHAHGSINASTDPEPHAGYVKDAEIATLLDETEHDALDHTGLTGCGGAITVQETDGSPSVASVSTIIVSNGKLTDNGGGSVSLDLSGDAGSPDASTVTYTPTTATDWDGDADPGDVDAALDQLAERVDDLEGAGSASALLDQLYDAIVTNDGATIDVKVTSGAWVALIFFTGAATSGWRDPTNAVHTVTAGKTLKVVAIGRDPLLNWDSGSRQARLQNTTDNATVIEYEMFRYAGDVPFRGEGSSALPSAAAGKTVKVQLYNSSANARSMGAWIIGKEV